MTLQGRWSARTRFIFGHSQKSRRRTVPSMVTPAGTSRTCGRKAATALLMQPLRNSYAHRLCLFRYEAHRRRTLNRVLKFPDRLSYSAPDTLQHELRPLK